MRNETACSPPASLTGKRARSRLRVSLPARIVSATGSGDCTVVDVSETGARVAAPEPPRPGVMVVVRCLHLELFGTLVWRRGALAGIAFDAPLRRDQVVGLRGLADEAARMQDEAARQAARAWAQGYDR
ncbi:PilZ domain-containing protein [Porphyrobacter sp. GA68]|uniref:PilZ domain-containing protein n=1 Tax=Porphyrobacter sp. GA68 TaxID=2883480 RepID=UPI001D1927B2|nr:PilZ domain-containing protein [Porphyrobacter sp. GA68]